MKKEKGEIENIEKEMKKEIKEVGKVPRNIKEIINKVNNERVLIWIIIVLVAILAIYTFFPNLVPKFKAGEKKYNIEVIKIETKDVCKECFDLNLVISSLKQENVNLKERSLNYKDKEAIKLLEKYNIEKIPALIVTGKIDKLTLDENIFRISGKTGIFDKAVPYLELISGEKKGFVNLIEIYDSSCLDCTSLSSIKTQLERIGIKIDNYEMVDSKSEDGKKLIEDNKISYLPSLLVSKNIEEYWWIFDRIKGSFIGYNDYYRFSQPLFPNKEISTGKIKGKVKITYITNNSCTDCYNVTELKDIFSSIGIYIESEKYVDVSSNEGESLLSKYSIKAIPTAVLSKEISDYTIKNILERVGRFINDEFVLDDLDSLNVKYQKTGQGG